MIRSKLFKSFSRRDFADHSWFSDLLSETNLFYSPLRESAAPFASTKGFANLQLAVAWNLLEASASHSFVAFAGSIESSPT